MLLDETSRLAVDFGTEQSPGAAVGTVDFDLLERNSCRLLARSLIMITRVVIQKNLLALNRSCDCATQYN